MFAAGMFARLSGRSGKTSLETDLKRVTELGVIEVPKEFLAVIVESSKEDEEQRRAIMGHLRETLAEPSSIRWRRIHGALVLVEELLEHGAPELLVETAEGRHFDLVQRLSLLERFENSADKRVQNSIRSKATALRALAVSKLETASELLQAAGREAEVVKDTCSVTSGSFSVGSCSTTTSASISEGCAAAPSFHLPPQRPEGQMILNGVVAVGHREDTTSDESSGDEAAPRKPVAYRKVAARPVSVQGKAASPQGPSTPVAKDLLDL